MVEWDPDKAKVESRETSGITRKRRRYYLTRWRERLQTLIIRLYKRSDFGKFDRRAVTQVDFAERVAILLACIGGEENLTFVLRSFASVPANHQRADWTYEIDNGNQVTLRYWLSSLHNIEVSVTNPPCIFTAEDNNNLIDALTTGVRSLMAKVADHS